MIRCNIISDTTKMTAFVNVKTNIWDYGQGLTLSQVMNTAKVIEIRVDHFYFAFLLNTLITGTDVPVLLALTKKTVLRCSFACCSRQNECTEKNHKTFYCSFRSSDFFSYTEFFLHTYLEKDWRGSRHLSLFGHVTGMQFTY